MRIRTRYSHLNGEEYLRVHHAKLWREIRNVIKSVDADACRTKKSEEKRTKGRMLYAPKALNEEYKRGLSRKGWSERRNKFWVASDEKLLRGIHGLPEGAQKQKIIDAGHEPIMSYNQTDFLKHRIAVEVQFGHRIYVAHDLFVKHLSFYISDMIDVGVEILPIKELEREMSSSTAYYEAALHSIVRQGRGVPAVPLVLVGVGP